jgi:hypothetical protein
MNNYQDRYIRENPRKNAKMSPVLWDDNTSGYFSYNKNNQVLEGFNGEYENKVGYKDVTGDLVNVVGATNVINYSDINGKVDHVKTQVKCNNGKAKVMVSNKGDVSKKMYDVNPEAIMNNKILGTIDEVDKIHNGQVVGNMSFDRMMLNHFQNTSNRLHHSINNRVISHHSRVLSNDPFFNPKAK